MHVVHAQRARPQPCAATKCTAAAQASAPQGLQRTQHARTQPTRVAGGCGAQVHADISALLGEALNAVPLSAFSTPSTSTGAASGACSTRTSGQFMRAGAAGAGRMPWYGRASGASSARASNHSYRGEYEPKGVGPGPDGSAREHEGTHTWGETAKRASMQESRGADGMQGGSGLPLCAAAFGKDLLAHHQQQQQQQQRTVQLQANGRGGLPVCEHSPQPASAAARWGGGSGGGEAVLQRSRARDAGHRHCAVLCRSHRADFTPGRMDGCGPGGSEPGHGQGSLAGVDEAKEEEEEVWERSARRVLSGEHMLGGTGVLGGAQQQQQQQVRLCPGNDGGLGAAACAGPQRDGSRQVGAGGGRAGVGGSLLTSSSSSSSSSSPRESRDGGTSSSGSEDASERSPSSGQDRSLWGLDVFVNGSSGLDDFSRRLQVCLGDGGNL